MGQVYISERLRQQIIERASGRCEYCRLHEDDVPFAHQIDHIVAIKHGGQTSLGNLALSCLACNRHKGTDMTTIDPSDGKIARVFDPRSHVWNEHFRIEGLRIEGQTPVGRATVALLRLNDAMRIMERQVLSEAGRFP